MNRSYHSAARWLTVQRLFTLLLFVSMFVMGVRETLDPDMWWHLRTGEYILDQGLPTRDVFSFTVPHHQWITHEWLAQLFMWIVYRAAGLPGLILVFAWLIAITHGLLYLSLPARPYVAGFVTLLSALTSALVWGVRPQIFNLLGTAAFLLILERIKEGKLSWRYLWLLPPLTMAWANLHSGYLLGVVLLATYAVGETFNRLFGRRTGRTLDWRRIRQLMLMVPLSLLAAALNPNHVKIWWYPFATLASPAMQANIIEWHSPDFHQAIFWPFAAMLAIGVASWLLNYRRPTWTEAMLFMGTGAAGLLSARHIPLFALISAPVVARHTAEFLRGTSLRTIAQPGSGGAVSTKTALLHWLVLILALIGGLLQVGTVMAGNEEEIAQSYPVGAVDYLVQSGLAEARGYNSYNWGGYLIWRGIPVYIDGRADVYDIDGFIEYYLKAYRATSEWSVPLDEMDVTYVLMERGSQLAVLLSAADQWEELYADPIAQLFVRAR